MTAMTQNIHFYLFHRDDRSGVNVDIFPSASWARVRWIKLRKVNARIRGLLFAGLACPKRSEVNAILDSWHGILLIAESCRWFLPTFTSTFSSPVASLRATPHYPQIPIYAGESGWGYLPAYARVAIQQNQSNVNAEMCVSTPISDRSSEDHVIFGEGHVICGVDIAIFLDLPSWSLQLPLDRITISNRCLHILEDHGLKVLQELASIRWHDAMCWRGFGPGMLQELTDGVASLILAGPKKHGCSTWADGFQFAPLMDCVRASLDEMSDREASVWKGRIGLNGPRQTLQQIASTHSITREGVRKIEMRIIRSYPRVNPWIEAITPRIEASMSEPGVYICLKTLEERDNWFAGVSAQPEVLPALLGYFGGDAKLGQLARRSVRTMRATV